MQFLSKVAQKLEERPKNPKNFAFKSFSLILLEHCNFLLATENAHGPWKTMMKTRVFLFCKIEEW